MLSCPRPADLSRSIPILLSLFGLVGSCLLVRPAGADLPTESARPIAPRGGIMMLPLREPGRDGRWPSEMTLTLQDGRELTGRVGWITRQPPPPVRRWSRDPRGLEARAVRPDDRSTPDRPGRAVLLVRVPEDGSGSIRFGPSTMHPFWVDLPAESIGREGEGSPAPLAREWRDDRPDPDSPFEHWRWVLLAERLDRRAPDPPPAKNSEKTREETGEEITSMIAQHFADLWRAGLYRIEARRPDLASLLRDNLTWIGRDDDDRSIAVWVAATSRTNELLGILLHPTRSKEIILDRAQEWADQEGRIVTWVVRETAAKVELALLNPGFRRRVATLEWDRPDQIPLAVELLPGSLTHTTIDRPPRPEEGPRLRRPGSRAAAPDEDHLEIRVGEEQRTLSFGPRVHEVRPPGFVFPSLRPPATLASIRRDDGTTVDPAFDMLAQLRKREGRWELYIECRRPTDEGSATTIEPHPGDSPDSPEAMRHRESFTLWIGEPEASRQPRLVLIVPETGPVRFLDGSDHAGTFEVHRRRYRDRWIARLVLPDEWLDLIVGDITSLALVRTFAHHEGLAATPGQPRPWGDVLKGIDPVQLDLTNWSDLSR